MPTDVEIAQAHTLELITTIADRAGIPEQSLIPYGTTKAKIDITTTLPKQPANSSSSPAFPPPQPVKANPPSSSGLPTPSGPPAAPPS